MDNPDTKRILGNEAPKSFVKNRIISCMILAFYVVANVGFLTLLSQFIHSRYEEEFGANKTNSSQPHKSCYHGNTSTDADEIQVRVQQETSLEILKLTLCVSLPPVVLNMVLGSYSDHIGRKVLFILPIVGSICKCILVCLVVRFHLSLQFLLLGVLLEGLSGGFSCFVLANLAYTADVTPTQGHRTLAMVIIDSTTSGAVAGGQILTGFLIQNEGFFYPVIFSLSCLVVCLGLVIFGLPETVEVDKTQKLSPVLHLKKVFGFYTKRTEDNTRCIFILCFVTYSLVIVAVNGKYSIETLYQLGTPFCWDALTIGYWGALSTLFTLVCGLVAARCCSLCVRAEILGVIGLILGSGSLVLEGLASNDAMMYGVPVVASFSSISIPVIRSIMSTKAGPTQQGALFSSLATVDTLCTATGGAAITALYSATVETMRGFSFLVLAGIVGIASLTNLITVYQFYDSIDYELLVPEPEVNENREETESMTGNVVTISS